MANLDATAPPFKERNATLDKSFLTAADTVVERLERLIRFHRVCRKVGDPTGWHSKRIAMYITAHDTISGIVLMSKTED